MVRGLFNTQRKKITRRGPQIATLASNLLPGRRIYHRRTEVRTSVRGTLNSDEHRRAAICLNNGRESIRKTHLGHFQADDLVIDTLAVGNFAVITAQDTGLVRGNLVSDESIKQTTGTWVFSPRCRLSSWYQTWPDSSRELHLSHHNQSFWQHKQRGCPNHSLRPEGWKKNL
jgi:hypothetical protein